MKKRICFYLLVFILCLTIFTGCSSNVISPKLTETEPPFTSDSGSSNVTSSKMAVTESPLTSDGAKLLYEKFLSGEITAKDKDGKTISIDTYLDNANKDYKGEYTIFDMNGDGIPELYIKTVRDCTIFWIEHNEVTVWRDVTNYSIPLNNMAILSTRPGGAPKHTTYIYFVLGYNGDDLLKIDFEEYYEDDHGKPLSTYFYQGVEVTKEVYEALTKPLLKNGSDKIIWHKLNNRNNQPKT